MRNSTCLIVAFAALAASTVMTGPATAQVQVGVVIDRDGLRNFHLAIGQYYGYPVQTVSRWHSSWVHADELPVVYLLAREARVSPEVIIALREQGWSWMDITHHLGVDPYIYVSHLGPPYGVAHGYWRRPGRSQLRRLSDRQIIDYVNVYFWAGYHQRPVREIIVIRERVPSWTHYAQAQPPRVRAQPGPAAGPPPVRSQPRSAQPRGQAAPSSVGNRALPSGANRTPAANRAPTSGANRSPAATRAPTAGANRTSPTSRALPSGANRTPAATRAPTAGANRTSPTSRALPSGANRTPTASRAPTPGANRAPPESRRGSPPAAKRRGGGG